LNKTNSISLECQIRQELRSIVTEMDGEKVMMSIENGKYYNLGEVGGEIWDLIDKPISVHLIVSELVSKFLVEEEVCKEHVLSFLTSLHKEGLITVID
jgi:hypothetical protein